MGRLIQLKLSQDKLTKYNKLVVMLGLIDTFGEYQRAIDFSIDFTISELERQARVLPNLESNKLDLFASTITKLRKQQNKQALIDKLAKTS